MTDLSGVSTADLLASLDGQSSSAAPKNPAFSKALSTVFGNEGGYSNNPSDRGGETNFGISSKANPGVDVKKLTRDDAANIYKKNYWDAIGGDNLPPATAIVAFDAAVNHGPGYAKQLLQQTGGDPQAMLDARSQKYASIIQNDPSQAKFANGWSNRLKNVADVAASSISGTANAQPQAPTNDLSKVSTADLLASLDNSSVAPQKPKNDSSLMSNIGSGIASGVADVGNTLINAASYLPGKVIPGVKNWNDQRNASLQDFNNERSDSTAFNAARIGANIAATLPVGGVLGAGVKLASKAPAAVALADALASGGLRGGNLATRVAGGAGTGAASSALLNPNDTGTGAAIGGALPIIGRAAGAAGNALAGTVSPEVAQLAQKAQGLGINLRLDQLKNSKPLNALSSALDYLPFSGKGAAMNVQQKQFNTALSKTIGENTDNIALAVKNAESKLGGQFDDVLKNTSVKADNGFQNDLSRIADQAKNEMTDQQYGVLNRQINNILDKVQPGDVIDADAAYNIKKGLDRLSKSNDSTLAYYARDTRNALIDALNRSLPDGGEAFAKTRQQWGNLQELNRLVPNGAEGDISAARLGNARNIRSKDLGDLSDIAAQFLKGRIGDSGTAQRAGIYAGIGGALAPKAALLGMSAGRAANSVLNNKTLVNNAISNALGNSVPQVNNSLMQYLVPAAAAASTSRN